MTLEIPCAVWENETTAPPGSVTFRGATDTGIGGIGVSERTRNDRGKGRTRPTYGAKRRIGQDGYVYLYRPGHVLATTHGYVAEHRYVLFEAGIDPRGLNVHHRNENKQDNRLENLEVLTGSEHTLEHHPPGSTIRNQYGEWVVGENNQSRERYVANMRRASARRSALRKARREGRLF